MRARGDTAKAPTHEHTLTPTVASYIHRIHRLNAPEARTVGDVGAGASELGGDLVVLVAASGRGVLQQAVHDVQALDHRAPVVLAQALAQLRHQHLYAPRRERDNNEGKAW